MKEIYYEESAAPVNAQKQEKLYKVFKTISVILYVIGVLVFLPGLSRGYAYFFGEQNEEYLYAFISAIFIAFIFIAFGVGFTFANKRINISYDYAFVSGEMRISRVHGNRRKHVYIIRADEIYRIGKVFSEE